MISQKYFNYHFSQTKDQENFFVNYTNQEAYNVSILNNFNNNIFLYGPRKSGKSHLINIWKDKNNALTYEDNFFMVFLKSLSSLLMLSKVFVSIVKSLADLTLHGRSSCVFLSSLIRRSSAFPSTFIGFLQMAFLGHIL